jgi:hypothetical protein
MEPKKKIYAEFKPLPQRRWRNGVLFQIFNISLDVYIPLKVTPYANRERRRRGWGTGGGAGAESIE